MSVVVTHSTVLEQPNNPADPVSSDAWNANHLINIGAGSILFSALAALNPASLTSNPSSVGVSILVTNGSNSNALPVGTIVYINSSGKAMPADTSVSASTPAVGVVFPSQIAAGGSGTILILGIARNDNWSWTPGLPLYLSTSGALTTTAPTTSGDIIQIIGLTLASNIILVLPNLGTLTLT